MRPARCCCIVLAASMNEDWPMLLLTRKTDYALLALASLARHLRTHDGDIQTTLASWATDKSGLLHSKRHS